MLKLIGMSLILLAGGVGAALSVWQERRRLAVSEGFLGLMHHLCTELERGTPTYAEMLACCEEGVLLACGDPGRRSESPLALLQAGGGLLTDHCFSSLEGALRDFGRLYRDEQYRRCLACRDELERECKALRDGLSQRERSGAVLPLALCAMAVLTLL